MEAALLDMLSGVPRIGAAQVAESTMAALIAMSALDALVVPGSPARTQHSFLVLAAVWMVAVDRWEQVSVTTERLSATGLSRKSRQMHQEHV